MKSRQNFTMPSKQAGFTLIELMISLVLGLLITAAAVQIYIINVRTATVQKSGSELQDASVFGLQVLENHLRLANLGNPNSMITNTSVSGGVVLSGLNIGVSRLNGAVKEDAYTDTGYLTRTAGEVGTGTNGWTGISNTNVGSDQLTIQFRNITKTTIPDCEGNDIADGEMVIERFFLRQSTSDTSTGAIKKLVLACDAGRVVLDSNNNANGIQTFGGTDTRAFGQAGQEFMSGVDQFKILLGVQGTEEETASTPTSAVAGSANYVTSQIYNSLSVKPAINSIKLALIVSGSTPIVGSEDLTEFTIFGTPNTLKEDSTRQKLVRNTYETTVILRNARVMERVQ